MPRIPYDKFLIIILDLSNDLPLFLSLNDANDLDVRIRALLSNANSEKSLAGKINDALEIIQPYEAVRNELKRRLEIFSSDLTRTAIKSAKKSDEPHKELRWIQGRVLESTGEGLTKPVTQGLISESQYTLRVLIGPRQEGYLCPPLEGSFPEENLPPSATGHQLQVVLSEPKHIPEPQIQWLFLPVHGVSEPCEFQFRTAADSPDFEGRIAVLYQNRVLQTALLRGKVYTTLPVPKDGPGLYWSIEALVSPSLASLEEKNRFDLAFVVNHNADNQSRATEFSGTSAKVKNLRDVESAINDIKDLLAKIPSNEKLKQRLGSTEPLKDTTGDLEQWLSDMSHYGSELYIGLQLDKSRLKSLLDKSNQDAKEPQRIQIVTVSDFSFLPLEFVYDRPEPRLDPPAKLCKKSPIALSEGKCSECDQNQKDVICPLGFWGLSKVFERYAYMKPEASDILNANEILLRSEPIEGRDVLKPFESVVFAASQKVNDLKPDQRKVMLESLYKVVEPDKVIPIENWDHWRQAVQEIDRTLQILLSHTTIHPRIQRRHGMEISGDTRYGNDLEEDDVFKKGSKCRPITLLLGCETASPELTFNSLVAGFIQKQSALVLGTNISVPIEDAVPLACDIVNFIHQILKEEGADAFSDILPRLRRQALLDGNLIALALLAYGDARWRLSV